jgi:hypothetical protein
VIGSIRSECLNHVIVLNERHLKRIMTTYLALCLDVEVREAEPFVSEPVDTWRRRTTRDTAAVTTELAVAEIIHEDQNCWACLAQIRDGSRWNAHHRADQKSSSFHVSLLSIVPYPAEAKLTQAG